MLVRAFDVTVAAQAFPRDRTKSNDSNRDRDLERSRRCPVPGASDTFRFFFQTFRPVTAPQPEKFCAQVRFKILGVPSNTDVF